VHRKEDSYKEKMKLAYDRRHGAQPLEHLKKYDVVILDGKEEGRVQGPTIHTRSYIVETPSGELQTNRKALVKVNQSLTTTTTTDTHPSPAVRDSPQTAATPVDSVRMSTHERKPVNRMDL